MVFKKIFKKVRVSLFAGALVLCSLSYSNNNNNNYVLASENSVIDQSDIEDGNNQDDGQHGMDEEHYQNNEEIIKEIDDDWGKNVVWNVRYNFDMKKDAKIKIDFNGTKIEEEHPIQFRLYRYSLNYQFIEKTYIPFTDFKEGELYYANLDKGYKYALHIKEYELPDSESNNVIRCTISICN